MNDRIINRNNDIKAPTQNDSNNSSITSNNVCIDTPIDQKLNELQLNFIASSDQKAAVYFSWVKHILTLNTGVTVLIAALAQKFFTETSSCALCLIVVLCCLVLAFFYGALGLIGETDYHDAKCVGYLNDICNQERARKQKHKEVIQTRHYPFVNPKYANFANHALCFFSLGMASLVLYVVGYVLHKLLQSISLWNGWVDGVASVVFAGVLIGAQFWIKSKINKNGFDWQRLEVIRERLYKEETK